MLTTTQHRYIVCIVAFTLLTSALSACSSRPIVPLSVVRVDCTIYPREDGHNNLDVVVSNGEDVKKIEFIVGRNSFKESREVLMKNGKHVVECDGTYAREVGNGESLKITIRNERGEVAFSSHYVCEFK